VSVSPTVNSDLLRLYKPNKETDRILDILHCTRRYDILDGLPPAEEIVQRGMVDVLEAPGAV
jgi:hypothetical protein